MPIHDIPTLEDIKKTYQLKIKKSIIDAVKYIKRKKRKPKRKHETGSRNIYI